MVHLGDIERERKRDQRRKGERIPSAPVGVPCALIARDVADEFFQWVKVIQRGLNDGQARDSTTQISFSRGGRASSIHTR